MGFYTRSLRDYDGEDSAVRVNCAALNAGNIAAQLTLQSNFGAAINDMSMGSLQYIRYGNEVIQNSDSPEDTWAQRELKWRVNYRDTVTGDPHWFTIPCANATLLDPNNRKQAYMGDAGDVDAFVAAAEAYILSPDGNAIEIESIILVGRDI